MRKLYGSIRRIAIFFMAVILTVQTATVTPVFAEGQDNKLQVEIFVTKKDNHGTSREDFYYIGKANITYPANVSLDAIYDDILKQGNNELSWSDAQRYGVKVDFDIQSDEFATEKNCQGSKQYSKLDNIKSDEEKEMNESFSWLRIRRRKIGHWHIDGALTFTEKQTYKVKFRDADGTILDEQDVKEGESAKAPSNPTKEGYTFTGWDKSLDNISGDTDITAEYEVIKNKVTFEDENGNKIKDVEVEYNGSVSENDIPQAPEKEGYTFVGWDTDLDNITEDITVRPKYEKNEEPEQPTEPTKPEQPTEPTKPEQPAEPTKPEQPTEPTKPEQPEIPGADDGNTSDDNNGNNNNASDNNDSNNSASDDNNNDSNNNASDNAPSNNVPSNNAADSTPAADNIPAQANTPAQANIPAQANTPAQAASVPSSPSNDTPADNSSNDVRDANNVADAANNNQNAADDSSTDNSNADGSENDNTNDAGSTDNNRNNRNNRNGRNNTTNNNRRNTNNRNNANNANNTNDDANAPAQNNTVAVANLIPQNNDTQDAVANINDEQTPLAAGDENADTDTNTSNGDDKVVTTIADDDTPLAAAEDNCIIHWIILLLTLLGAGYTIIRVVLANKQEQEEENKQEA